MRTTTRLPVGSLLSADLLERRRGVREDLQASVARGDITEEQAAKFMARIEASLLAEQREREAWGQQGTES